MKQNGRLSEADARALWARAAALEAVAKQETQHDDDNSLPDSAGSGADGTLISADIARQAAIESGIEAKYVDAAQLELGVESFLDDADRRSRNGSRPQSGRALGFDEIAVAERTVIAASVNQVRVAATGVLSGENFASELIEIVEPSPERLALVYEVPANLKSMIQEGSFHYEIRQRAEIKRFAVLFTAVDGEHTELAVYALLDRSLRVNIIAMRAIQSLTGAGGAVGGGFGASALAGVLGAAGAGAAIITGAGAVALAFGGIVAMGAIFRSAYRTAYANTRESFRRLLTAIKASISTSQA
jgi:hypothetical protein